MGLYAGAMSHGILDVPQPLPQGPDEQPQVRIRVLGWVRSEGTGTGCRIYSMRFEYQGLQLTQAFNVQVSVNVCAGGGLTVQTGTHENGGRGWKKCCAGRRRQTFNVLVGCVWRRDGGGRGCGVCGLQGVQGDGSGGPGVQCAPDWKGAVPAS